MRAANNFLNLHDKCDYFGLHLIDGDKRKVGASSELPCARCMIFKLLPYHQEMDRFDQISGQSAQG